MLADSLRYGIWFAFMASLLGGMVASAPNGRDRPLPRWLTATAAVALLAAVVLSSGLIFRERARPAGAGSNSRLRLALAIVGLALVEQLYRRDARAGALGHQAAVPRAGRAVRLRPLLLRRRACCSGASIADIWVARGVANALRDSVHRHRDGAQRRLDDRDAPVARRGVPFDGAARLGRVPAGGGGRRLLRPLLRRRLGPRAADRAAVRGAAVRAAGRVVRAGSARGSRCSSASTSSPTATTTARSGCASRARSSTDSGEPERAASERSSRSPTWSRARRARCGCARSDGASRRPRAGTCRRSTRVEPARRRRSPRSSSAPAGSSTSPSIARDRERYPELVLPAWLRAMPIALARRSADRRAPSCSASSCWRAPRTPIEVNWEVRDLLKTASRAGGELPGADPRDRGAARGAQVRRVQPDVGLCRPRPEEPRGTAFADAQECRAPPRQPGVPARHAEHRRARRRSG